MAEDHREKSRNEQTVDKKREMGRMIKFFFFSVSAGVIELVTFTLLNELTGAPYWPCYLTALVLSIIWNFILNRKYTFKSASNVPAAMIKVALFYGIFTPFSTIIGNYFAETLHWNEYLVTGINMAMNFITEYVYDRFIVFRKSIDTNALVQGRKDEMITL